jgi:bifunctional DNA-binding transcriptional regulator/antitoxin component of YhaV-PrlF toxin-antitoxin module
MATLSKVQSRGQVTLTREVRQAAGIEPGDTVIMRATRPGTVELTVLPQMTLAELLEEYAIEGPVDIAVDRERWQELAAQHVFGDPLP